MLETFKNAFVWWRDGLAGGLSLAASGMRNTPTLVVEFPNGEDSEPVLTNVANGSRAVLPAPGAELPKNVVSRTRGADLEYLVPPHAILQRDLDPLPRESLPYVDSLVRHRLDNLFPWRSDTILHATQVSDGPDSKLDVRVSATSRAALEPVIAVAKACQAGTLSVVAKPEKGPPVRIAVPLAITNGKADWTRKAAQYMIFGLLALLATSLVTGALSLRSVQDDIAVTDEALASRRAVIARAVQQQAEKETDALGKQKQASIVSVLVLEWLSAVLPNDTYLSDLAVESGKVRMTGYSARATDLVPLLEASGYFDRAAFYAPTTRVDGEAVDRFSIEALVKSPVPEAR